MGESEDTKSSRYDVIVVGAGPAGISAAINVANRKKSVVVMDSQHPFAKPRKAPTVANYPGFDSVSGEELATAFVHHLEEFEIPFLLEKVSKILREDNELIVFTARDVYHAGAVVLATGVYQEAQIEGETELVGRGVTYCVSCDGRLFSGRDVVYVSYVPEGEEEATALAEDYHARVTFIPLYKGEYNLPPDVRVLPRERPSRIHREEAKIHVQLRKEELIADGVFIYKRSVALEELIDGLEVEGDHIKVNRWMETGIPGIFAAGDCTGEPYQIGKAVGEGQVAALQAVRYLREPQSPRVEEPPALKAEDREALSRILRERMVEPVRLLYFGQEAGAGGEGVLVCPTCREARRLLEEFCELSPKLTLEVHDFNEDLALAEKLGVKRIPATLVGHPAEDNPRMRFYGVPSGYEFGVLLDDILDLSSGRTSLSVNTLEALDDLEAGVHLEVMTTPTCPYCPGVVRLAHRFARTNPFIVADMVAVNEYPEVVQRYQVTGVPLLVVDGRIVEQGGLDEERLLELVIEAAARGLAKSHGEVGPAATA